MVLYRVIENLFDKHNKQKQIMIQDKTILNVIDNSGAKTAYCIKVMKGYRRRYACTGDIITVAVRSLRKKRKESSKIIKGDISKALLVRTKVTKFTNFHEKLDFFENAVILITKQKKLLGTRIFGAISKSFRYT